MDQKKYRYLLEYDDILVVKCVIEATDRELNRVLERLSRRKVKNFKLTQLQ